MITTSSQEIGVLFEKASFKILNILFEKWGYKTETLETRPQKGGSQHGFDIYLKIYDDNFLPIHVFIECKGSKDFNLIDKYELATKSDQLKRNTFPVKDVHLFFSPTRAINYKNDEPFLEDDDNPFCVIDMMRKNEMHNDTLNLFMSYEGKDSAILDYRNKILAPINKEYKSDYSFDETVSILKGRFHSGIKAYLSKPKDKDITLLTPSFWNHIKEKSNIERLPDYYIRLDSVKTRLLDVVANDYHISNTKAKHSLLIRFKELVNQRGGLIKILSNGGEGKSTFLLDLGKEICKEYPVFLIQEWNEKSLEKIEKQLSLLGTKLIPVILLDDAIKFEDSFRNFGETIANWPDGMIVILAERYYRYQQMPDRESFERLFQNEAVQFNFRSSSNAPKIFQEFFKQLRLRYTDLTNEDCENSLQQFLTKGKYTIAERIFMVLKDLHQNKRIVFHFDWDEWDGIHKNGSLKHLYLLVSAFYQFGNSITFDFCREFNVLSNIADQDFINAVDKSPNQPIVRNEKFLQLRHEKVSEWFIEEKQQQDSVKSFYQEWLRELNSPYSKDLLLWTYRNNDFIKCKYLKEVLNPEKVLNLLLNYIVKYPKELPARTEIAKIYQQQKKWDKAEDILLELLFLDEENIWALLELNKVYQSQKKWTKAEKYLKERLKVDPEGLHPRTELSKIYQQQKKWDEAIKYLKEYIVIDPEGLHPRTELSKIYQQLKKWKEAENILLELLDLDKENLQARTELSKIYQQQKKWKEAEDILLELLELDIENLQARTELSKIYQQQKKWKEAEDILLESLVIDKEQLHPRTELSKIYQQQKKWKEAENILLELLELDTENLQARTELSKIYQQQKKWKEAEDILLESLVIDKEQLHPRTELSKIYQQQKKWKEAENILLELLELDTENLQARTELSKIYQQQKKWKEAENILLELLELDTENLQARTELSKIYQQQKKWKEAEDILLESLVIDKDQLHPRTELSKIYQHQKKWKEAEDILLESLVIDKDQLHPRTELSKIYQHQKKWDAAIKYLKEYIALDPEGLHPRTELSKIYQHQKKWKEAEDILLESLVIDKEQLHPRTELSKIYQHQKKWDEAIKYLKEYIALDPEGLHPRTELSKIYQYQKKWKEAEDILNEILFIDESNFRALTEKALLYKHWGQDIQNRGIQKWELKQKYLNAVVDSYRANSENISILMELAYIFITQRKYRAALTFLELITELKPDDLECIRLKEMLYSYMKDDEKVLECRKKGEEIIKKNPFVKFRNRFENQYIQIGSGIRILSRTKKGTYRFIFSNKENFIVTLSGSNISIPTNSNICKDIRNNNLVFYGLYSNKGEEFADSIEPYFSSINDLSINGKSLKI